MQVKTAKSAGFCFGVQRAVDTVYEQAAKGKTHIYTYGPIIHNEVVVRDLEEKGVRVLNSREELEELRKREERKDRLHQNYLKRKANGKQKEYEERTKAKKKAEVDARKQVIRTEDIARGVFIPVSSLPQLEPRKGA